MTAMKAELGDEAVILHSKKYKEGGILGIGSREVVEITAAVEETSLPKKSEETSARKTVSPSSAIARYKTDGTEQAIQSEELRIRNELAAIAKNSPTAKDAQPIENIFLTEPSPTESLTPESLTPESLTPESLTPESLTAETSTAETSTAETSTPETSTAETSTAESSTAETSTAETSTPETSTAETSTAETSTPETSTPETSAAETSAAETSTAETSTAETSTAETSAAETSTPETSTPETSTPETSTPQQPVFTQEQMAQTQAMIMAQFNQMQMMQQAAIAQAQAQAAEQIRLQQAQAQAQQAQPAQVTDSQSAEKIRRLEDEIAQMKALLAEVLGRDPKKGTITLHEAMKRQEVDEEILTEMASQSNAGDTLVDVHTPTAKTTLMNYLNEHVKFADGIKLNRHGVRIAALLGTTGVGKTTTLAKIAAKFVLEQRTNVALITADTYRISAVEQLKTYSDILELPLEIVYNPAELTAAIERHRDKELILIDTAGRSQHNDYQMRELEEFLQVNPRIEKHLVISATTKLTDARQIMNKFSKVNPDRIVFTKTDETSSLGMIINLLRDSNFSLSYVTTGQSVPDDIERASADILTDLLLKKIDEQ